MTTAPVAANENVRQFYVYQHRRKDTGEVFYIGKGCRSTSDRSVSIKGRNRHWHNVVNKHGYSVEIICDGLDERTAFELETWLISYHGRLDVGTGPLVNMTDGGEGESGRVFSLATRAKISAANINRSRDLIARIADATRNPSAETRARMGSKNLGRMLSEDHRAKISAGLEGRVCSEETRAKLRVKRSDETKDKICATKRAGGPTDSSSSGYKGVYPRLGGKWSAQSRVRGQKIYLGVFQTAEEAARAYDAAAIAAWGAGNCYLNFPEEFGLSA